MKVLMDDDEARTIGRRLCVIRRRRGLGLSAAAGLAGISKPYLSMLERGERGFSRRGLIEDFAQALGCAVADLTGQPYLPPDRATMDALGVIAEITSLLYEPMEHAQDLALRPVEQLTHWAAEANAHCDEARYALAGRPLATLLNELQVHATTGFPVTRRAALTGLVEACVVAFGIARQLGHPPTGCAGDVPGAGCGGTAQRPRTGRVRGVGPGRGVQPAGCPPFCRYRARRGEGCGRVGGRPHQRGCARGRSIRDDSPARGTTGRS
ncbi:MAG TPA: helix-turn-helix transcriptional regulator [Pseudonocardiaceae bacterium]|nr:helix-turn-helix transcriptional regulator [Pseudonocardiaceae bacterium]